jgi:hypothetical protein
MRSVTVPATAAELNALLEQARAEDLLVHAPDGAEFIVSLVDEFDREVARTRQNRQLMDLLDERARNGGGGKSLDAVKHELGLGGK